MKILTYITGVNKTNCYFVIEGDECLVIDPGGRADYLRERIASAGLRVRGILLTHAHFDHMLAVRELRDFTAAPLCVHRDDAPGVTDPSLSYMSRAGEGGLRAAEVLFDDGDTLAFAGHTVTVLHTPGHTKGSCCYILRNRIFTGDTLFRGNIGRCDLYGGNTEAMASSLARMRALFLSSAEDYLLYPGHGDSTRASDELSCNPYFTNMKG